MSFTFVPGLQFSEGDESGMWRFRAKEVLVELVCFKGLPTGGRKI